MRHSATRGSEGAVWTWLGDLWSKGLSYIGQAISSALSPIIGTVVNGLDTALSWLAAVGTAMVQFFNGFIYLLERIVTLAGLVVQVVALALEVLVSVVQGTIATFSALASATIVAAPQGPLATGFSEVRSLLDPIGFQQLGYLLGLLVWILLGVEIINTFRSM